MPTRTLVSPSGPIEMVVRDLAAMPRNAQPPAAEPAKLRGVTIHYAGGNIGGYYRNQPDTIAADAALITATIAAHNARPGYTDVGYNLLVGRSGAVFEGRGLDARNGANGPILAAIADQYPPGTTTTNAYWVAIFLAVGTDPGYTEPTAAQWETARRLVDYVADLFGIAHPQVNGHRDVRATACPGDALHARLAELVPSAPPPLEATPAPTPPTEDDDMNTARRYQDSRYHNVWLIGAGSPVHLTPALATDYAAAGVPLVTDTHDQMLKALLFQCGLTNSDLVSV